MRKLNPRNLLALLCCAAGVLTLYLNTPASVRAGCGDSCVASETVVRVEPQLDCMEVDSVTEGSCGCDTDTTITNRCSKPLSLPNIFTSCGAEDASATALRGDCSQLASGEQARTKTTYASADGVGSKTFAFTVESGQQSHEVSVTTQIESFETDGCSVRRNPPVFSGWWLVLVLAFATRTRVWRYN